MNIWDSVQRSLEKASSEAGRIARIQRLRTIIEQLTRQQQAQRNLLADRVLELFNAGQLMQGELLLICQELTTLQQQVAQVQQELKLVQSQGPVPGQMATPGTGTPVTSSEPTGTLPPSNVAYGGGITLIPPPPPPEEGVAPITVSSFETVAASAYSPQTTETRYCAACQAALLPGYAFCHNCGTPVSIIANEAQPTRRSDLAQGEADSTILRPEGGA